MQDYDKAVLTGLLRRARGAEGASVAIRNAREKSLNEREACYRASGRGLFFCIHDKHFFVACASCKRTQAQADARMKAFLSKQGVV